MAPPSLSDFIGTATKQYAATNPYSIFGSAINDASLKVDDPYASFGANFAKGVLGSGLQLYGQGENQDYQNAISSLLSNSEMMKNPQADLSGIQSKYGLGNSDIENLKQQANVFRAALLMDRQQKEADADLQAKIAGKSEFNKQIGLYAALDALDGKKSGGEAASVGTGEGGATAAAGTPKKASYESNIDLNSLSTSDLMRPDKKEARDIGFRQADLNRQMNAQKQNELQNVNQMLTAPSGLGGEFLEKMQRYNSLKENLLNNTSLSTLNAFKDAVKVADPRGVINQGEFDSIQNAIPALERRLGGLVGKIKIDGSGAMSLDTKLALLDAVNPQFANTAKAYGETLYNPGIERLKLAGYDDDTISKVLTAPKPVELSLERDKAKVRNYLTAASMPGDSVKVRDPSTGVTQSISKQAYLEMLKNG